MPGPILSILYVTSFSPHGSGFTFNIYRQRNTEPERFNKVLKVTVSGRVQTLFQIFFIRKRPIKLASKNENQTTAQ